MTNGLTIKSAGNGGTYPFRVTWAGGVDGAMLCVNDAGNVGIGITNPSRLFQVSASADGYTAGISGLTYGLRFDNGGSFGFGGSTIHGVDKTLTSTYQILALNGSQLLFGLSGTEKMRLTAGGYFGINTSPSYRLHVASDECGNYVSQFHNVN